MIIGPFSFHYFVAFISDIAFYCYCTDIKMKGLFIYLFALLRGCFQIIIFLINVDFLLLYMHFNDIIKLQFHGIMNYKLSNMSWSHIVKVFLR